MRRTLTVAVSAFALSAWLLGGAPGPWPGPGIDHALAQAKSSTMPSANGAAAQQPIDINSASVKELRSLPGIGPAYAKRITENRPYKAVEELYARKVLPKGTYQRIQDKVVATAP